MAVGAPIHAAVHTRISHDIGRQDEALKILLLTFARQSHYFNPIFVFLAILLVLPFVAPLVDIYHDKYHQLQRPNSNTTQLTIPNGIQKELESKHKIK